MLPALLVLGGCNFVVLSPSGYVALEQRNLLLWSTGLMLLIIIPVMTLTILFAWRYRQANASARYEPDWDHSMQLELVIWAAPLLIIICLGALTWVGTHMLDPFRPLNQVGSGEIADDAAGPLEVEVVALDWKWLFIYPDYGIATVNELVAPVDRPINFRITASTVMNSFYIPALAGQIYAMPGMETRLHAVINRVGDYDGFSANYSGAGFSGMRFGFHGVSNAGFEQWVRQAKANGTKLDRPTYMALEKPSENDPVRRFATVDPSLFNAIVNMCVEPGRMCLSEMMAIDAAGGHGMAGLKTLLPRTLAYDRDQRHGAVFGDAPSYVVGVCSINELARVAASSEQAAVSTQPLLGAGLVPPSRPRSRSYPVSLWLSASRQHHS